MNEMFHCGDHEMLVAYLYDECDRAGREAIAAHLTQCAACAEEIASLRATRTQLAAWAPPDARLGFQITSADQRNEPLAFVAPPSRRQWWREPLPAWAQAAAAVLIFAAGMTAGSIGRAPGNAVATAPPKR
jgi:anti-sigma factor RsiW